MLMSKEFFEYTLKTINGMTFVEAIELLNRFNRAYAHSIVYWDTASAKEMTFWQIGKDAHRMLMPLKEMSPIWFQGGPPDNRGWICGPPAQYVADCVLREIDKNGWFYVSKVIYAQMSVGSP